MVGKSSTRSSGPRYGRDESEFDRAIGFVDATFALALTLLVTTLEIGDPASAWTDLGALYDAVGNQFLAFLIAFAVISSYWLAHHRLIASFTAIDTPVIVANLALIGAIVVLPFSTNDVGDPGVSDLALPTAVMAVNVALASTLHSLVYALAAHRGLLASRPSRRELTATLAAGLTPAIVFLASIPIAYLASPLAAQLSWTSLLAIGPLAGRYADRARAGAQAA